MLTLAATVEEFFHEVVTEALTAKQIDASEPAGWYLVNLLGELTTTRLPDEPLGVKLAKASQGAGERVRSLKEVGDTSLVVAGFFAESLGRSLVDVDYYVSLGKSAYGQLARHLASAGRGSRGGQSITEVYGELADNFPRFVDVLSEVKKRVDFGHHDLMHLYEVWLRTRDEWVEDKLRDAGLIVGESRGVH
ncbi:MAG: hypothetical protein IPI49_03505 [Myxococcales bacterium]|jgi:hypothetical protein|nr:hypothetical protein [Myxococcales bacterium]